MLNRILIVILFLSVSACAAISTETSGSYNPGDHPNSGLAVVTVEPYNDVKSAFILLYNAKTNEHITATKGKFTTFNLPAGDYKLTEIRYSVKYTDKSGMINLPKTKFYVKKFPKPYLFSVKTGKTVYLGKISVKTNYDIAKILNAQKKFPGKLTFSTKIKNTSKKDLSYFKSKYKNVDPNKIEIKILK